jgi:hypothetical protein
MTTNPQAGSVDVEREAALQPDSRFAIWPTGPRCVLAALAIAAALLLAWGSRAVNPSAGDSIVAAPRLRLDPNTAPEQVLGALPEVGPTMVRRFVSARNERPITSPSDLRNRVPGVGPATLDRLAPYLRFDASASSSPDSFNRSNADPTRKNLRAKSRKKPRSIEPAPTRGTTQLTGASQEKGPR